MSAAPRSPGRSPPGLVQSRQTGRLTCADAGVERLRSGAKSEPARRQTDRQVAPTCEGVEHSPCRWGIAVEQGPDSRGPARHPRRSGAAKLTLQRPCDPHRIGIPALPRPPRPVILPSEPRASRSVVLAAARLRALHLDPPRHPTAPGSYAGTTGPLTPAPVFIERFSHQDQPYADGQRMHRSRSGACASGGAKCHVAGPAPSGRDRSRQRLAAALTSGADRTLRAGADSW
jgi:hypothetical protein